MLAVSAVWKKEIEEFVASGLTRREWCSHKGIARGTFDYRLMRVKNEQRAARFLELLPATDFATRIIKIHFRGICLEISEEIDSQSLCKIVQALALSLRP